MVVDKYRTVQNNCSADDSGENNEVLYTPQRTPFPTRLDNNTKNIRLEPWRWEHRTTTASEDWRWLGCRWSNDLQLLIDSFDPTPNAMNTASWGQLFWNWFCHFHAIDSIRIIRWNFSSTTALYFSDLIERLVLPQRIGDDWNIGDRVIY